MSKQLSKDSWLALKCVICGKKASWCNEGTGRNYCTQCMEDVAFK
tara:strand:- start:1774 stop:1908 length:135 start_codon:yes stop_codon:yes gene_type:complete